MNAVASEWTKLRTVDRITSYDVIADPDRLSRLSLAVLSAER